MGWSSFDTHETIYFPLDKTCSQNLQWYLYTKESASSQERVRVQFQDNGTKLIFSLPFQPIPCLTLPYIEY